MRNIVVLGAGFGGLKAAKLIAKGIKRLGLTGKYEVVLVDRNEHHTYTPLLYEAATTSKETANFAKLHEVTTHNIWQLIENLPIVFVRGEVASVDIALGDVHLKGGEKIAYDNVIIALGSEINYFGIPGLKEHSLVLKDFKDAIRIRDAVWNLAQDGRPKIDIIIGGGGATGVELAGELVSWCGELSMDFPRCRLVVKIVEGGPTVLGGMDARVIASAQKRLAALEIEILVNKKISRAEKNMVVMDGSRSIGYDVLVWSGGVKAPELLSKMPLQIESRGRLMVEGEMGCLPQALDLKLRSMVYAIGDSVCLYDPKTKKTMPAVARVAISQAGIAAHNILEDIKFENGMTDSAKHKIYEPRNYPYITPIGGKWAVAKIGPLVISGFLGWFIKGLVELFYLFSIMPPLRALATWLKGLKIFIQNDRLG